jgi:hypothetical protein
MCRLDASVFGVVCLALLALSSCVHSGNPNELSRSFFSDMMYLEQSHSARVSSYDRTGGNTDFSAVKPGDTLELARLEGAGCIRHIYFTIWPTKHYLRELVLRMYWDGESTPSVEVPFGDFFGEGQERVRFFRSLMVTVNPGAGGVAGTIGFNSYFPMPFEKGARLTLTNEGKDTVGAVWYHVDYDKFRHVDSNVGRFHAQWRRVNPTVAVGDKVNVTGHDGKNTDGKNNYVILDAEGRGNLAGYFLNIDNVVGGWYGEGDDMIFIDGETWPPSFHGTGTEEIFGGGACPNTEYAGPYTGYYLVGNRDFSGKVGMYRFFVTDPIRFQKSIRVTIEHGHANNFANDYCSTAFWYQSEPHKAFPRLPAAAERLPLAGADTHDQAFLKFFEARKKFSKLTSIAQKQKLTGVDQDIQAAQTAIQKAEGAFEKEDFAAVAAACEEALKTLNPLLEKYGK